MKGYRRPLTLRIKTVEERNHEAALFAFLNHLGVSVVARAQTFELGIMPWAPGRRDSMTPTFVRLDGDYDVLHLLEDGVREDRQRARCRRLATRHNRTVYLLRGDPSIAPPAVDGPTIQGTPLSATMFRPDGSYEDGCVWTERRTFDLRRPEETYAPRSQQVLEAHGVAWKAGLPPSV